MLVFLLPLTAVAVLVVTVLALTRAASAEKTSRYAEMQRLSLANANDFGAEVKENQGVGRSLATLAEGLDGKVTRTEVNAIVKRFLDRNPQVVGAYVGYERNAFDGPDAAHAGEPGSDDTGRYGPYWNTLAGKVALDPLVDQDISDYWNQPKKTLADSVIEPYLYEGVLLTSYTAPVERDGKFVGIGGVDVSLSAIHAKVSKLKILDSGYGLLVSNGGIFVSAPDKGLIGKKTLADLAKSQAEPGARAGGEGHRRRPRRPGRDDRPVHRQGDRPHLGAGRGGQVGLPDRRPGLRGDGAGRRSCAPRRSGPASC